MAKNTLKQQDNLIDTFVQNLLSERNFSNIDRDVVEQIKTDLHNRVEDNINATIIEKMPVERLGEFETLLDSGDENEIQNFCSANIPDLDQAIGTTLAKFAEDYLK